jgi:MFS family permease
LLRATAPALQNITRDGSLLFATRISRLFAYGALSVVLVFYLVLVGLTEAQIGLLLTLTLMGDTAISLLLTTRADRFGRRRTLIAGAALMTAAGLVFASSRTFWILVVAGTLGVISPSGQEVGPFLSIEQAALSHLVSDRDRTDVFAWYALVGSIAAALGSLTAGTALFVLRGAAISDLNAYRTVVLMYAAFGVAMAGLFSATSNAVEVGPQADTAIANVGLSGLHQSGGVVAKLSALFALDAFGGGFIVQSFAAYWFYLRFGIDPAALGVIFFLANILAGLSALVAARLARRVGLIRTMVWTHIPSNVLLILLPLMPTLPVAVAVLLARLSISQMDVPVRQSYIMAAVDPSERSAAAGITGVARTTAAAVSPLFVGVMFATPELINLPFFIAGTVKLTYDLLLYWLFVGAEPQSRVSLRRKRF